MAYLLFTPLVEITLTPATHLTSASEAPWYWYMTCDWALSSTLERQGTISCNHPAIIIRPTANTWKHFSMTVWPLTSVISSSFSTILSVLYSFFYVYLYKSRLMIVHSVKLSIIVALSADKTIVIRLNSRSALVRVIMASAW